MGGSSDTKKLEMNDLESLVCSITNTIVHGNVHNNTLVENSEKHDDTRVADS